MTVADWLCDPGMARYTAALHQKKSAWGLVRDAAEGYGHPFQSGSAPASESCGWRSATLPTALPTLEVAYENDGGGRDYPSR